VHVAGLQAGPVQRAEVAHRVAGVGVLHQLGLGCGAAGEVQQQRLVDAGLALRRVDRARVIGVGIAVPAGGGPRRRWRCAPPAPARSGSSPSNLPACDGVVTTARTRPRSKRSIRSSRLSSNVAGIITAPILMQASISSHSGTSLPSISSTRSPRATPRPSSQLATRLLRAAISAKVTFCSLPSSATIHSAVAWLSRARSSKWSSAQLKWASCGQRKPAWAASRSVRWASRKSRAAR
jgi:hypothetical protein